MYQFWKGISIFLQCKVQNVNYEYVEHIMIQWIANFILMSWNFIKEFYVLADNMKRLTFWSWCNSGTMLMVLHILLSSYNPSLQSCCNNASYFYKCHTIEQSFFIYDYVLQHSSYKDISWQMARCAQSHANFWSSCSSNQTLLRNGSTTQCVTY